MTEEDSLRLAIHEPLRLVAYDESWPGRYEKERARLGDLSPKAFLAIEHIGSTAVPTLSAKPLIDIMAGISSLQHADELLPLLRENGYVTSAEFNAKLTDSRWLMRHENGQRTHHLHLLLFDGDEWRRRLAFRDALKADPSVRFRYGNWKLKLMSEAGADREAYTAMKTKFIDEILRNAEHSETRPTGRLESEG